MLLARILASRHSSGEFNAGEQNGGAEECRMWWRASAKAQAPLRACIAELVRVSHPFSGEVVGPDGLAQVIGRLLPYLGKYTVEDAALLLGAVNIARELEVRDEAMDEWIDGHEPLRLILEMYIGAGRPASQRCVRARKYMTTGGKMRAFPGISRSARASDQKFVATGSFPPSQFGDLDWVDEELKAEALQPS